jgi:hypothetical protein
MNPILQGWVFRRLAKAKTVPIAQCVHYCAFRYGCGDINPYENYALALARGEPLQAARDRFLDFLRHYRPDDFGAALGVTLSRSHGLWQFPWGGGSAVATGGRPGWVDDPDDAPDIITHFSARGILKFRLEEEFLWAERLFYSLRRRGFQERPSDRAIEACTLTATDGATRYLIIDGNHRISALVAAGHETVTVRCTPLVAVRETALPKWPRVRDGTYTPDDARRVFRAYFTGNQRTRTTDSPAPVLEVNPVSTR